MRTQNISLILLNGLILVLSFLNVVPAYLLVFSLVILNFLYYRYLLMHKTKDYEEQISQVESASKLHQRVTLVQSSQLETIIQNLPFPIALLDVKGAFSITNQAFNAFYKSAPKVYDEKSHFDEITRFVRFAFLKEEGYRQNLRLEAMDVQAINVPIYDAFRYGGCLLMFLDVTSLLDGERMQKRFIADASHELKTPLTSILGMVEILNRPHFNDPETLTDFLIQIEEEAKRMQAIIKDLTEISKTSNTKMILNTQEYTALSLIEAAVSSVAFEINHHQNQVMIHCDKNIKVKVDQDKFHQILTNLISNAAKYTTNGNIDIYCTETTESSIIEIKDTGIGINAEDQAHIFDRFFRSDSSRSRASGGSGLGLAIVKTYVGMHHGEISVSSKLNEGSTFKLRIPK